MITLGVEDLNRSITFYGTGLQLPRFPLENDSVAFFQLNGTWLGLYGWKDLAEDAKMNAAGGTPAQTGQFPGFTIAHNLASEELVDAQFTAALKAGAKEVKKPEKVFWGGYSGYFADLDGYLWEIAYNPMMWIGPEDTQWYPAPSRIQHTL